MTTDQINEVLASLPGEEAGVQFHNHGPKMPIGGVGIQFFDGKLHKHAKFFERGRDLFEQVCECRDELLAHYRSV